MDININDIRQKLTYVFEKYNFKTYNETKEQWINRKIDYFILLLQSNMKILDISQEVRKKYNTILPLNKTLKDIIQHSLKLYVDYCNIPLKMIKERYTDNFEKVEERMMFRIELYKDGWTIEQIERYVYKYLLKEEYPNLELELYECLYNNIMKRQEIYKQEKEKKLGRPSLPSSLKEYIKNKHQIKIKDNMRQKYAFSNKYESIKDYLLTKEEIEEIKCKVSNENIINKIVKLQL